MKQDSDKELTSLRNELDKLDREKEEYFAKSKSNRNKIIKLKKEIEELKKERNQLTDSVRIVKAERDKLNKELSGKIAEFKKRPRRNEGKPRVNIGLLKKEIKGMEYKIETEALSFDKEQKLMKAIKEKKKIVDENSALSEEGRKTSMEIDAVRAKADEAHKITKAKADESQKKHELVIVKANELKEAIKEQKAIEKKCSEYKRRISEINQKLHLKLKDTVSREKTRREQHPKKSKREQNIAEMQQKAEEKLKKGGTITTEDLLAFQKK